MEKKKKHIFHPDYLAERKFRARSLPAVVWCWSLPWHERGCGDTCGDAATKCPGGTLQPQVDGARLGPSVWSVVLLEFFMRLPGGRAGGGFGGAFVALALSWVSLSWVRALGTRAGAWGAPLGGSTKSNPNAEAHRAGDGRELGTWQGQAQKAKGIYLL